MGCLNSVDAGGGDAGWRCQYCGQSFRDYASADQHERMSCPRRPGAAGQQQQLPAYAQNPYSQGPAYAQNPYSQLPSSNGTYGGQQGYRPGGQAQQGHGMQAQQGQQQPEVLKCGRCQRPFGIPPGHAQVKCPHCNTVNAVPNYQQAAAPQPTIPTNVYNQSLGVEPAPVVGQPGPKPSGRKKALLIGINYFGTRAELRGCINDVHRMQQLISQLYGFPGSQDCMLVLTDDQHNPQLRPTRSNILRGLRWLAEGAQPGDCLFFHYSGHGAQQEDPNYAEEDGYDETICPSDFQSAGMIVDDEIFDLIVAPLPSGTKLTALMDCCHSGTGLDLPFEWKLGQNFWQEEDNPCHSAGDVVLISGCQDDQTSSDGGGGYGRPMGAMTTSFCNVLERNPMLSFDELLKQLRQELRRGDFDQLPQLTASQRFDAKLKLFSPVDYIEGNSNEQLGRLFRKKKHPKNPNLLHGGLGEMLMAGAAGFLVSSMLFGGGADLASGLVIGGLDAAAGGAELLGGAAAGGAELLGDGFAGVGDFDLGF